MFNSNSNKNNEEFIAYYMPGTKCIAYSYGQQP